MAISNIVIIFHNVDTCLQFCEFFDYTLSHLENDRDVIAYSGGRRLSSCAQLVCFLTRSKRNTEIDAYRMRLAACILGRAQ